MEKKKLYLEEYIALFFTIPVIILFVYLYFSGKINSVDYLYQLLIAAAAFAVIIFLDIKYNKKHLRFLRTYFHIPYYGIIFTAFQSYVHKLNPNDWDEFLLNADMTVFGFDITVWFESISSEFLTEIMIISYFSYYLLPTLSAILFYYVIKKETGLFNLRRLILALVIGWYAAFLFYIAMPAAGPDLAFPGNYQSGLKGLSSFTNYYLQTVTEYLKKDEVRNTFPSMHFAIILIINYFAYRLNKKYFFFVTLPLGTGLMIATLYLRQHYLIDLVGSIPVAANSIWLSLKSIRLPAAK